MELEGDRTPERIMLDIEDRINEIQKEMRRLEKEQEATILKVLYAFADSQRTYRVNC